jgi:hypothetical protein
MICYETPDGHQAMLDWSAGHQHGVASARESGYRELFTLPVTIAPATVREPSCSPESAPPKLGTPTRLDPANADALKDHASGTTTKAEVVITK